MKFFNVWLALANRVRTVTEMGFPQPREPNLNYCEKELRHFQKSEAYGNVHALPRMEEVR